MIAIRLAAIAALLGTSVLSTPALALPEGKPPTINGTGTPQEICDAQLTPDEQSEFDSVPLTTNVGAWENDGAAYPGTSAGPPSGYGTPTFSNVVLSGSLFRNGGSPNVWGGGTATTTYPQTQQLFNMLQDQTRTTTFDCHVHKTVGSDGNPQHVEPPGLQSSGNTVVEEQTVPAVPPTQVIITNVPFVVYGATIYTLVCISPNTGGGKPGAWRGMHGVTDAQCNAWQNQGAFANLGYVPSGNSPDSFVP